MWVWKFAAAEQRLCQPSCSLYRHKSTAHFSVHPRLPTPSYTSQAWKGEPSLVQSISATAFLHASADKAMPAECLCDVQLKGLLWTSQTIYFPFASCACAWEENHAFIQRSALFLDVSVTRFCQTKALQMPGTLLFVFSFPLTIGTPCNAELSPSLSHFSGQLALTAPWMSRSCRLHRF